MTHSRLTRLACSALLVCAASVVHSSTSNLLVESTFERGTLDGWSQVRTNIPKVTTERARSGKYSMKSELRADAPTDHGKERNEVQASGSHSSVDTNYWYGYSIFLPSDFTTDGVWELISQWFPYADNDAEWSRHPTLGFHTNGGIWSITNRSSPDATSPIDGKNNQTRSWKLGALELNKWTDWVINARWTHKSDGFLKIWKDGKLVVDYKGPTNYNDKRGPFVKLGLYKGWAKTPVDKVSKRTAFYDDFRMAGANGSYEAVAPGRGGAVLAKAPAGLVVE